jgi:hypothetical protein
MTTITLSTTLTSRPVIGNGGAPISKNDPDAQAFITAANITDTTQKNAINTLVLDLKAYALWAKFIAIYPYVGGTATTHKFNLINPLDDNAAFRITWNGGVTHNANGITGNGTNGYGETYIKPSTNLSLNSVHMSFWSKTNSQNANAEMGIADSLLNASLRVVTRNTSNNLLYNVNDNTASVLGSQTDSSGFYVISRTASNLRKTYKNGTSISSSSTGSIALSNATIPVLGQKAYTNTMNAYLAKNHIFATVGQGLTDVDVDNMYTAVLAFQTALGR